MNSVLLPRPLWERVGERGPVDDLFNVASYATVTLSLTLSPQGRGDLLNRSRP